MPLQYVIALEDNIIRTWLFALTIVIVWLASAALFIGIPPRLRGYIGINLCAASNIIITIFSYTLVPGCKLKLAAASLMVIAFFLLLTKYASRFFDEKFIIVARIIPLAFFIGAAVLSLLSPIYFPRAIGVVSLLMICCGALGSVALLLVMHTKRAAIAFVLAAISVILSAPNNHRLPVIERKGDVIGVRQALSDWLDARRDLDAYRKAFLPYPVVLVSSEGGGIYAAAHAYLALSVLAKRCQTFAQHVFATVGVSGGALGNALFVSSVNPQQNAYSPCSAGPLDVDDRPVAADHLSPVVARFLLLEPLDRIIPGQWLSVDRAGMLTQSFRASVPDPAYLDTPITQSWRASSARPAVISVTTDVSNGRRLILSPIDPSWGQGTGQWWPGGRVVGKNDTSLIEAAGAAARFPWITPTALLMGGEARSHLLADGGYFENSGADTVLDLANEIRAIGALQAENARQGHPAEGDKCRLYVSDNFRTKVPWSGCNKHVFIVHLAITTTCISTEEDCSDGKVATSSFLLDPIFTLLSTRSSRGALALQRASIELCGTIGGECTMRPAASLGFFRTYISAEGLRLPLGWHLQKGATQAIRDAAVPPDIFNYRTAKAGEYSQSDLAYFIYHFDVALYDGRTSPKIEDLFGGGP